MITTETSMCICNGTTREMKHHTGVSTDVIANGDGTYTVIDKETGKPIPCNNADDFLAIDTRMFLICDGETGKWHKQ